MCITNNINIVKRLQKKDEIAVYKIYTLRKYRGKYEVYTFWGYTNKALSLETNKIVSNYTSNIPYRHNQLTSKGIYGYRNKTDGTRILNTVLGDRYYNFCKVKLWVDTKDIIAADKETIVARKMYLDDESWEFLWNLTKTGVK